MTNSQPRPGTETLAPTSTTPRGVLPSPSPSPSSEALGKPYTHALSAAEIMDLRGVPDWVVELLELALRRQRAVARQLFQGVVRLDGSIDHRRLAAFTATLAVHTPESREDHDVRADPHPGDAS